MILSKYNMTEPFNINGYWFFDPQKFENKVYGTLEFKLDGIYLTITILMKEDKKDLRIYGFSDDGKLIILNNCLVSHQIDRSPGISYTKFSVRSFFIIEYNHIIDLIIENGINPQIMKYLEGDFYD